jgi:hypothetical protein
MDRPSTVMHKRRIKLPDGRYLIFYTFDDERSGASQKEVEITGQDDEGRSKGKARKHGQSRDRLDSG